MYIKKLNGHILKESIRIECTHFGWKFIEIQQTRYIDLPRNGPRVLFLTARFPNAEVMPRTYGICWNDPWGFWSSNMFLPFESKQLQHQRSQQLGSKNLRSQNLQVLVC